MKLVGKIIFKGILKTRTGLHIGGSKATLSIGSVDNNVIKTALGRPYIPGSSLKGKLRSLIARVSGSLFFSNKDRDTELRTVNRMLKEKGSSDLEAYQKLVEEAPTDEDKSYIMELFGYSGDNSEKNKKNVGYTRLLVRDAFLVNEDDRIFKDESGKKKFTDIKFENVINRVTGTAEHPRQQERVPVGAEFGFEMVYSIYDDASTDIKKLNQHLQSILMGLQLLEDDGLGGSISRGYGQVKVEIQNVSTRLINEAEMKYEEMTPVAGSEGVIEEIKTLFQPQKSA